MKKWCKITIPKPCHENWNNMTVNEKGKFCDICTKTVIDFTKKSTIEVQEILLENKGKRICGHFNTNQLGSVNIEIPNVIFSDNLSYTRIFTLALLLAMGTSIMSCKTDGKVRKIETIEIVDSNKGDTIIETHVTMGMPIHIDEVDPIITIEGELEIEDVDEDVAHSYGIIETKPKFKNQKTNTSKEFSALINEFIQKNINLERIEINTLLKDKHKIFTLFTIDSSGNIKNIRVRAQNEHLENEIINTISKIPQLIPGKENGATVAVTYALPIIIK